MSYTETKYVTSTGDVVDGTEYRNSHGICAFVWEALLRRYRPHESNGPFGGAWGRLWKDEAAGTLSVEPFEHNVLHFTYDNALVRREDCATLVESLRKFVAAHPADGRVCHLAEVADEVERELARDAGWQALGLYGTSICEDPWSAWDPEAEESAPYNINAGTKHWFIEVRR